jgi:hypothetical protein
MDEWVFGVFCSCVGLWCGDWGEKESSPNSKCGCARDGASGGCKAEILGGVGCWWLGDMGIIWRSLLNSVLQIFPENFCPHI